MRISLSFVSLVWLAGSLGVLQAQPEKRLDRIRELNGALLNLGPAAGKAAGDRSVASGRNVTGDRGAAAVEAEAAGILEERARELSELMRESPAAALEIAFSKDLAERLREQYPKAAESIEVHGRWQGSADYVVLDDPDAGRALHEVRLETERGWVQVHFAESEPEGLQCGQMLEAVGIRLGDRLAVKEAATLAASATTAPPCAATGEQRIAVFLVTFPGVVPPSTVTPAMLQSAYFGAGPVSLAKFWHEGSMGKVTATGQVFPWRTLSRAYTCDEYYQLWNEVLATMDPEVDFRQFNRIFLVFPKPTGCGWAGLANVGCRTQSTADGVVSASVAWLIANYMTTNNNAVMLAAHEGGHNLGLSHAASRDFGAAAVGPLNTSGTISEYGDKFSAMGYWNLGHYSARHRQQLGWFGSGEIATVQTSGTWQLRPASSTLSGIKALKVARGSGNTTSWIWLESRQPVGAFDATLRTQVFSGALAHYQDGITGSRTNLLDFTEATSTFDDPAKAAGAEWSDAYSNLKFQVSSATKDAMSVSVSLGAPPCAVSPPTVTLAPVHPSVEAQKSVTYTLTLKNNDSTACANSTFTLASAAPAGWPTTLSAQSVTAAPGQTVTATVTKTVGSTAGTFAVTATATRGSSVATASANCTVTLPVQADKPSIVSWPSKSAFTPPEEFVFTLKATQGSQPLAGESAAIVMVRPDKTSFYRLVTLDANGMGTFRYKSSVTRDIPGEYIVKTVLRTPVRIEVLSTITILAPATN